jgi:SnoaL-like domain
MKRTTEVGHAVEPLLDLSSRTIDQPSTHGVKKWALGPLTFAISGSHAPSMRKMLMPRGNVSPRGFDRSGRRSPGGTSVTHGADGIRKMMAAYVGLKPHMDVVTHHTTVDGDFAMTRSQWLIEGTDKDGKPTEVHHHGMEVHRRLPDGTWVFFMDHPFGADPSWAIEAPPHTE